MTSIAIVGTGRLAKQLYSLFTKHHFTQVSAVLGRSAKGASYFTNCPYYTDFETPLLADIVFIAVSDASVAHVSKQIKVSNALVCHVSGSVPLAALETHKNRGVFYPLQTFGENSQVDFQDIPLLLEAQLPESESLLLELAQSISTQVVLMNSQKRKELHLAAIWVNNFTNYLAGAAHDFCDEKGLDFNLLHPLLKQTTENIIQMGAAQAQTGPARRGDSTTLEGHMALLKTPIQREIYQTISQAIGQKYIHEL